MKGEENSHVSFKERYLTAKNITYFAILLALVIVLQLFASYFKIGSTSLSFVLVPIVLCGMILGPWAACFLGFAFGLIVVIQGFTGMDDFTLILLNNKPFATIMLCLVKGSLAGLVSGYIYKLIKSKNKLVATFIASAVCPIVNTGLFILGALLFLGEPIKANSVPDGNTLIYFLVIGCAGINFIIEFAINLICAPAILKVTEVVEKFIRNRG